MKQFHQGVAQADAALAEADPDRIKKLPPILMKSAGVELESEEDLVITDEWNEQAHEMLKH